MRNEKMPEFLKDDEEFKKHLATILGSLKIRLPVHGRKRQASEGLFPEERLAFPFDLCGST